MNDSQEGPILNDSQEGPILNDSQEGPILNDSQKGFDVRAFARSAQGRFRDELDLAGFAGQPLPPDDLALVRFLGRVEGASMEHLRDILMTATHKDARVTAFLVTWAYEKSWIADALDAVVEAHGGPAPRAAAEGAPRRTWSERRARRGPLWRVLGSIRQGDAVVAAHMTAGLVDEWVMRVAYRMLADRADNGALSRVIDRIVPVKLRHEEFFATEARRRLRGAGRAVRLTRTALRHAVWPTGAVRRGAEERERFIRAVFAGADGHSRAASIGARVAALTGLTEATGAAVARSLRT
jgi:hypothetical protein